MREILFALQLSPFSTGEARPLRGTSRREIGHGIWLKELEKCNPN
ncbi:MAG: hypothetical protein CM15mP122_3140 [Bacteroidota bacterium]|nr:MAG: hypothetical protein CM15mP122_3140 [Bacteroidota bacterium]